MTRLMFALFLFVFAMVQPLAAAADVLKVQKVTERIYALVGPLGQRDKQNLGNNATFGVIVTDTGVVLVDPGGSAKGAAMVEAAIRTFTEKPVTIVINSGGQDHRWMGNGYFKAKGARIIASTAAVADHKERRSMQQQVLDALVGADGMAGTQPVFADETFEEALDLTVGGVAIQLRHAGAAHTPGDSFIHVPSEKTVFTGDIVYMERMLGVGPMSNSAEWLSSFDAFAALNPAHVVPGHGAATTLAKAQADTRAVLANLRKKVGAVVEAGGDVAKAVEIDQSQFKYLKNFDSLARRNAQAVFMQMEFE